LNQKCVYFTPPTIASQWFWGEHLSSIQRSVLFQSSDWSGHKGDTRVV